MLCQGRFTRVVAPIHTTELWHRDMAFVNDQQGVVRQILEQGRRWLARLAARQIARIVLDTSTGACRLDHLQIEHRSLLEPLRL